MPAVRSSGATVLHYAEFAERRFHLSLVLAIPVASWLGGALVERVVDGLLG